MTATTRFAHTLYRHPHRRTLWRTRLRDRERSDLLSSRPNTAASLSTLSGVAAVECLLPSRSLTLLPCEHPSCAPLIAHVQPCAHPNCAGTIATLNHSWHTRCRVRFETRLLSAVKLTQHVRTRCGSSLSPLIDIVQPSPAAGRGWHVLHTTTTCGAISDGSAPATHASPHPRAPGQVLTHW